MLRGAAKATARGAIPRDLLVTLVARDLSVRGIAAEVGRSPTTVRYWLAEYGLKTTAIARRKPKVAPRVLAHCERHGRVDHLRRSDGVWRCERCSAGAVTDYRRRAKRVLVDEAGGGCRLCGYDRCMSALHFHHRDPATKSFAIGGRGLARPLDVLRAEAAKCVLLCSNCHAEVGAGLRDVGLT
jgi:hypothetical protein